MNQAITTIRTHQGNSPLVVSIPHAGTGLPSSIRAFLSPNVLHMPDTDWFVDKLYDWVPETGASMIVTPWSRYVIDLNRPPDNSPLYANSSGTSLVPTATFDGNPMYVEGHIPNTNEVAHRLEQYWIPYHRQLRALLEHSVNRHGHAVLLDAHSIKSEVSELFDGELPHLNLGTNSGVSASQALINLVWQILDRSEFSSVRDQRFKGGYITRHYGQPDEHIHALQLEIAQRAYMQESPPVWDSGRTRSLRSLLMGLVSALNSWRPERKV